ncbi:MAG: hypothetical protein JSV62_13245, partial [Promethearchaeota archaeon]
QVHYINAIKQLALRLKDNPYVIGFDTMNEPEQGWIEKKVDGVGAEKLTDDLGYTFTPIDAILIGSGYSRIVGYKEIKRLGVKETRKQQLNEGKVSCWFESAEDIWKKEGVWDFDKDGDPIIKNNDYFVIKQERKVNFYQDYLTPFIDNYTKNIREIISNAIIFFESHPIRILRGEKITFDVPKNVVHAGHWYDGVTLGTKRAMIKANYDLIEDKIVMGKKNIQEMFIRHLANIKSIAQSIHEAIPTLIGEFGLPYDLNKKEAYHKFRNEPETAWNKHIKLLTMYYNALDANLLHSTQWNYTADNNNQWGDLWNMEDLSIFSRDQQLNPKDINSGGRAIEGFCRPHFIHCSGIPLNMEFNFKEKRFHFVFNGDSSIKEPTIIYVPKIQYPKGYHIQISEGQIEKKEERQLVFVEIENDGIHKVDIIKNE